MLLSGLSATRFRDFGTIINLLVLVSSSCHAATAKQELTNCFQVSDMKPVIVSIGHSVTLALFCPGLNNCKWFFTPMSNNPAESGIVFSKDGTYPPYSLPDYGYNITSPGQCDLIVLSANFSHAGYYSSYTAELPINGSLHVVSLTVISQWNCTVVSNATYHCTAEFVGPSVPSLKVDSSVGSCSCSSVLNDQVSVEIQAISCDISLSKQASSPCDISDALQQFRCNLWVTSAATQITPVSFYSMSFNVVAQGILLSLLRVP